MADRTVSWTVVKDGKTVIQQIGSEFDKAFPSLLRDEVNSILDRTGDLHGTLESFGDGTVILTLKSVR